MFDDIMNQLPSFFEAQYSVMIYLFLFLFAVLENLIPPIPGDVVTALGAFMVGTNKLHFTGVFIATTIGSSIGFTLLFLCGKFLGKELIVKKNFTFFRYNDILKAEQWIQKYGLWLVLANRFLPGIRSVISLSAGFARLSTYKVVVLSFISSSLWNTILIYLGYSLGTNWLIVQDTLKHILSQYSKYFLIFSLIVLLIYILIKIIGYIVRKHR